LIDKSVQFSQKSKCSR